MTEQSFPKETKKSWGGPRKGAGRKRNPNKKISIDCRISPESMRVVSDYAQRHNLSLGASLDAILRIYSQECIPASSQTLP